MSAKEVLRAVKKAEEKYKLSKELAEHSRYKLAYRGLASSDDAAPVTRDNTYENNLVNMLDLDERAKKDKEHFLRVRARAIELIDSLDDAKERAVLIHRYIYYEHWERIAEVMNYSLRQVHNINNRAMKHFAERLH